VADFLLEDDEIHKGRSVSFNASNSFDGDGRVIQYEWDFGDGSEGEITRGPWVNHVFERGGDTTVTLTVVDDLSGIDNIAKDFHVINTPPEAVLEVEPQVVLTGETVFIDGSRSFDTDGLVDDLTFRAIDPDGAVYRLSSGGAETVTFTPDDDGEWTIVLDVTDDDGAITEVTVRILVLNRPPVIALTEETVQLEGSVVLAPETLVMAVDVADPDGTISSVRWVKGEGAELLAEGAMVSLLVGTEEDLSIRVIVADDDGASAHVWLNLTINVAPMAAYDVDLDSVPVLSQAVYPKQMLTFDANNSSDPGGVVRYQWDFGDGFAQEGRTADHAYSAPGVYTVTLKVTDGHGATDEATYVVTVTESPVADDPLVSGTTLIIILVVAAAAVLAVGFMWLRGRGSEEEGPGV
jgi:chitodextrinase